MKIMRGSYRLRAKNHIEAEKLYNALSATEKKEPEVQFIYAIILQNKKDIQAALEVIRNLPLDYQRLKHITRKHSDLLIILKEHKQALKILENSPFNNDVYFRADRLECLRVLRETQKAITLEKQFKPQERQDPFVAIKLAYFRYYLGEDPLPAIAIIPNYKEDITLIKPLIQLYGMANNWEKVRSFFNSLTQAVKTHPGTLIVYANAMLRYKGDPQNTNKVLIETNTILVNLLKKNLSANFERKIINIILRYHLQSPEYQYYINRYVTTHPHDKKILLLARPKENQHQAFEGWLENPETHISELRQYLYQIKTEGDHKKTKSIYEKILEKDPNKAQCDLWTQYASFLSNNQYSKKALPLFLELIGKYPFYSPLYLFLSDHYERENNPSSQIEILRQGNRDCPNDYAIVNKLARSLTRDAEYHEPIKLYQAFILNRPDHIDAKVQLAYAYCRIGYAARGVELLQKIISPSSHIKDEVIIALGRCLIEAYQFDNANTFFQDHCNHLSYWTKFANMHAQSLQNQGKFQEAFKILETMHSKLHANKESYSLLFRFFHYAAKQKIKFEQVSQYIQNALNQFADDVELNIRIGFFYLEIDEISLATNYSHKALKEDPDNLNAKVLKNRIAQKENKSGVIICFDSLNVEELLHQGRDAVNNKQFKQAKVVLEKLQALDANTRQILLFFSQYYAAVGLYQKAESSLEKIKNKYSEFTVEEYITLTSIYKHTGRATESIALLENLRKANPCYPELLLRLSDLYFQNNDLDKATEICFDAIKIRSKNLRAILQLVRIAQAADSPLVFTYLKEADAIYPKDLQVAIHKSYTLQEYGRDEEALTVLLNIYNEHSEDLSLLVNIFHLQYRSNNLAEAKNFVNKLITLYADEPEAQSAYIRFKLTTEKEHAYKEVEEIFKSLKQKHPENPKVAVEYALFVKRRAGIDAAIVILNEAIKGPCKFYTKAYSELATLYMSQNKLNQAKQIYQNGTGLFPFDIPLNKEYLHFQLFVLPNKELSHTIAFFNTFFAKFSKANQFLLDSVYELMYRAGLKKYIPANKTEEEIVCHLSKLSLNDPALELLEKIKKRGYKPFGIGGLPRHYYLLNELKVDFPLKLRDIDIFTDAPLEVLQSPDFFPTAMKSKHVPNQLNFHYKGYDVDITHVDIRIQNLPYYLKSQKGLNVDCLVMDQDKIFDPTRMAKIGLQNRVLDFVNDPELTCRENPTLLFKIIQRLHECRCKLSENLPDNILKTMSSYLSNLHRGKILAEIMKILTRGHAKDSFNTMINYHVFEVINPTLYAYLKKYTTLKEWFFAKISQTDCMVNELNVNPSKPYIMAVYLMPQVFEGVYRSGKDYLDDAFLDELFHDTYGKRIEHPQIRYYIYTFFTILKPSLDKEYYASLSEISAQSEMQTNEENLPLNPEIPNVQHQDVIPLQILEEQNNAELSDLSKITNPSYIVSYRNQRALNQQNVDYVRPKKKKKHNHKH